MIWFTATVPAGTGLMVNQVTVTAEGSCSGLHVTEHTIIVNQEPGLTLVQDEADVALPGSTIRYEHRLTNTGNWWDNTITVTNHSDPDWTVTITPEDINLAPHGESGDWVTVTVEVAVPEDATCGVTNTTAITAISYAGYYAPDYEIVMVSVEDFTTVDTVPGVEFAPDRTSNVNSNPSQEIVITYTHRFTNTGNCPDDFDFLYHSSQGFDVTVAPNPVHLQPDEVADVTVYVTVPPTTTTDLLVDTTIVTGQLDVGLPREAVVDTTIVNQAAGVDLAPDNTATITQPASAEIQVLYTHTLTNSGNYSDTFDLTWANEDGWQTTVNGQSGQPVEVTVGSNLTTSVQVATILPEWVYTITNRTVVTAASQFSPTVTGSAMDTTVVRRPGVLLWPDYEQNVGPGDVITHVHWLTNVGGVSDSYVITYHSDLGWGAVAPATVSTLLPGEGTTITATISVPSGTDILSGTGDTLVVTATSQITSVVYDTAEDVTVVPYVPGAEIAPNPAYGQTNANTPIVYTHTLTNTGNYTESFHLQMWSEFANATVNPEWVLDLGPGESYWPVVVTVLLPTHAAAGETEETQLLVSFAGERVVGHDYTLVTPMPGTRYVARDGTDDNNSCLAPYEYGPCATVQQAVNQALTGDEARVAQGVYTDVHATGAYTQVVYLDKGITLRGGYTTGDWDASDPVNNATVLDAAGQGRVVYLTGYITPTIEGFHLQRGYVEGEGAGVYIGPGVEPVVRHNFIHSNTAASIEGQGGGVYYDVSGTSGDLVLERNIVYSNTAHLGGGFYVFGFGSAQRVWNNVLYHNTGVYGGGLYLSSDDAAVWNNTFYSNTAPNGGGICINGGSPSVSNTILAENAAYGIYKVYGSGGSPQLDYNLVWANSPGNFYEVSPGSHTITTTPGFVDAASYDFHLRSNSNALEMGDPGGTLPDVDLDGNSRPLPAAGRHDIGAYENGLQSAKTAVEYVPAGGTLTYTIVITNSGQAHRNILITDRLHDYVDLSGVSSTPPGSSSYDDHTVSWEGVVYSDTTAVVTVTTTVTEWLVAGTTITNVAEINYVPGSVVTTVVTGTHGTRYVAETGHDTSGGVGNNCMRLDMPCRTIQQAVDHALAGDEVRVASGTYTGTTQVVYLGKDLTLTGGYTPTLPTWTYDPSASTTTLDAQGNAGVVVANSATGRLSGLHIVNGADGVDVDAATVVISQCHIYNNTDGVDVNGGSYTMINNVVAHNSGAGVRTAGGSTGSLLHNTFARNATAGVIVNDTARFTNTVFYDHDVGVNVTAGSAYLSHTLWYSNTANQGNVVSSTNWFDQDPRFEDPDGVNYHIQPGSSAIDKGLDTWLGEDIDGDGRPLLQHPDLGADEFALVIAKSAPASAHPDQVITYSIMLQGGESGLVLTDTLDAYLTLVGAVECDVGSCGYLAAQRAVTWNGDAPADHPIYITYTAQITSWLAPGVQILNDAQVLIAGDVHNTNQVATTINAMSGVRYVDAATGLDMDGGSGNNCLASWKPCATVQWAVDQAQADDTVKVASGDYTGAGSEVVGLSKDLTLIGGYAASDWDASAPETNPTYLNGQNSRRAVVVTGTVDVTIDGLHLRNGSASDGGGLYVNGATVTLANSQVHDNATSNDGGGIYATNADLTLSANRIYGNTAGGYGGGVRVESGDNLTIERNVILDNAANYGGGASIHATDVAMVNNIVGANQASSGGDGLLFDGSGSGDLRHNTIADNDGDGVRVGAFTLALTNTILSGHTVGVVTSHGSASVSADHTLLDGNVSDYDSSGGGSISHSNDVTGSPNYRDQAGMDYHITGSSAAGGAGADAGVSTDIDGETRTSPPDIGADQYNLRTDRWASSTELAPCQTMTHTLALANVADSLIPGVVLTDTLPEEVTYNSGSLTYTAGSGAYLAGSPAAITWVGDVAAQSSVYITYTVNVNPYLGDGSAITFTASISDPVSAFPGNPLTATVRTIPAAIRKEAEGAVSLAGQATIGELVTYTVVYTVPGGHKAYDPVVVDQLPRVIESGGAVSSAPALTYVPGSLSITGATTQTEVISADGGAITWTLSSVTATCGVPTVAILTFNGRVLDLADNDDGDPLTNTVTIDYAEGSPSGPTRLIGEERTLTLVEPGLALAHAAEDTQNLGMGDLVAVTITATNSGSVTLYDVVISDTLGSGWVVNDTGGSLFTHTLSSIGAGDSVVAPFTVRVNDDVGPEVTLTATAEARGDSLPGAEQYERTYTVTAPLTATTGPLDLEIGKEGPAVRSPHQGIRYTIGYTNTGVVRAEGVQVADTLPPYLTDVVYVASAGATMEQVGQTVTWTLTAPVSRSVSGRIWITATVAGAAPEGTVLTNSVAITTTSADQDGANNDDAVATTVRMPALIITKTAVTPYTARLLTYTLTISNSGLGDATELFISDTLPLSTTYYSCDGGSCGFDGSATVTWTLPLLPAGEQADVTFTVLVDSDAYSGTVIVNPTYAVTCVQGVGDAGGPLISTVPLWKELRLEAPEMNQVVSPGDQVVYTHTLINWGTVIAPTATLTVSEPPAAWSFTLQPTQVVGLDVGADAGRIVTLTVQSPPGAGYAVAVITATWQGEAGVYATAVDTTTIGCIPVSGVAIDYSPTAPLIGQTVAFTGSASGGTLPFTWAWDFGDGDTASGQFATHVYDDDDSYVVELTVTNCDGVFDESVQRTIIVAPYQIYLPLTLRNYQ